MWFFVELVFGLVEALHFWRFFIGLLSGMIIVGLGDWLLPADSGWRDFDIPLLFIALVGGGLWEVSQHVREKK